MSEQPDQPGAEKDHRQLDTDLPVGDSAVPPEGRRSAGPSVKRRRQLPWEAMASSAADQTFASWRRAGIFDSAAERLTRSSRQLGSGIATSAFTSTGLDKLWKQSALNQLELHSLDLRPLLPGVALGRSEAFDLASRASFFDRLTVGFQRLDPANWRGEDLDRVAMLEVMEAGIPLVWTPGADVIRALTDEKDPAARRNILAEHAAAVISQSRTVLRDVTREDLAAQIGYLDNCLDLLGTGPIAPAQALAANVWDTTLRAIVRADPALQTARGTFMYGKVKEGLPKASMETVIGQFRAYCINTSVHTASVDYYGPPVPEQLSRHATSHATGTTQYTLANALTAVMMAVGLLRELQETMRPIKTAD
jgi:hypothetical protein